MRTFRLPLSLAAAAAVAASLTTPSLAVGQRHVRRSASLPSTSPVTAGPTQPCSDACGNYTLAVVSALLPAETSGASSDVVTLVIENRGTAPAPMSVISVAPRNHLSLASRSTIGSLAPGQRTTIQLPVRPGPDATECISITITPSPAADPATSQFLASAANSESNSAATPDFGLESVSLLSLDATNWPDLSDWSEAGAGIWIDPSGLRGLNSFSSMNVFERLAGPRTSATG